MKTLQNIYAVLLISLTLVFCSCQSPKTNSKHIFNGIFQIIPVSCDKVIDVKCPAGNCCIDGQKIILFSNRCADNQKWKLIPADESETYYIVSVSCNKAIEYYCLPDLCGSEEQALHIYNFNKGDNQKWYLVPTNNSDSTYYIYAHSKDLLIDIFSPQNIWCNDEQKIQLYHYNGGQNQKWKLSKVNT